MFAVLANGTNKITHDQAKWLDAIVTPILSALFIIGLIGLIGRPSWISAPAAAALTVVGGGLILAISGLFAVKYLLNKAC